MNTGVSMTHVLSNPYRNSLTTVTITISIPDLLEAFTNDFKLEVKIPKTDLNISNPVATGFDVTSEDSDFVFTKVGGIFK